MKRLLISFLIILIILPIHVKSAITCGFPGGYRFAGFTRTSDPDILAVNLLYSDSFDSTEFIGSLYYNLSSKTLFNSSEKIETQTSLLKPTIFPVINQSHNGSFLISPPENNISEFGNITWLLPNINEIVTSWVSLKFSQIYVLGLSNLGYGVWILNLADESSVSYSNFTDSIYSFYWENIESSRMNDPSGIILLDWIETGVCPIDIVFHYTATTVSLIGTSGEFGSINHFSDYENEVLISDIQGFSLVNVNGNLISQQNFSQNEIETALVNQSITTNNFPVFIALLMFLGFAGTRIIRNRRKR